MSRIETGVDKLVALIAKEKKIDLQDAAKQLNVDPSVVREWAEFLEEEGTISLQYSLSKTFLLEKHLTKVEVEKKGKEYDKKKEAFVRRVDAALKQLEDDTADFETIKKQYNHVKDSIGDEIDAVKEEIEQLKHYEELKKSIDHDILKQKIEYQKSIDEIRQRIMSEEKRYDKILTQIDEENTRIVEERREFDDIKREEEELRKRIEALKDIVTNVTGRLESQQASLKGHEERLVTLHQLAQQLHKDLVLKRRNEIEPMLKVSDTQAQRILQVQEDIAKKVKAGRDRMAAFEQQSREIADRFARFYDRRAQTERLLGELDRAKEKMKESLNELIRKAKGFDITQHQADIGRHVEALEGQFHDYDRKKTAFQSLLDQLRKAIVSKEEIAAGKAQKASTDAPSSDDAGGSSARKPVAKRAAKKSAKKR